MKNKSVGLVLIIVPVFFLTSCRSPQIVAISGDTYLISAYSAFNGTSKKYLIIKEANKFAEDKGKIAVAVSLKETHPSAGFGGHFEYQFKTVDPDSQEATNPILPIRSYKFDAATNRGNLTVDLQGRGVEMRHWIVKNIGKICSDQNITMTAGQETGQDGKYRILSESVKEDLLTIEFEAVY